MISFIVSAYDNPVQLQCCLASLQQQDGTPEIIVCGNTPDAAMRRNMRSITESVGGRYVDTSGVEGLTCYHSLDVSEPKGEWLCFPNQDSYYVPGFSELMVRSANEYGWQFVYCDILYDPRLSKCRDLGDRYSVLITYPHYGRIDKTCFLVSRREFEAIGGWPDHEQDWKDGALAVALVRARVRHGRSPYIMVIHN